MNCSQIEKLSAFMDNERRHDFRPLNTSTSMTWLFMTEEGSQSGFLPEKLAARNRGLDDC